MKIEVAVTPEASTKDRGDLLENLAAELLKAQSYEVIEEIRLTGVELDLLCKHKITGKEIYVECKAYRDNISANILKNLSGTVHFKDYNEGWLISTAEFGKEAKGLEYEWKQKPIEKSAILSFYTPEKVINSLIAARVIKNPPEEKAEEILNQNLLGEWMLLITLFGKFWAVTVLKGGLPNGVIAFYASTNELVKEFEVLKNLASTDTTLKQYDFNIIGSISDKNIIDESNITNVVPVQRGDAWTDYRPARPKDFVGRKKDHERIFDFFKSILNNETTTRIFAITGDSGMGKSSLIVKLKDISINMHYKNKVFIYAVDVRAATSGSYIDSSLLACLQEAKKAGFGNIEENLRITDPSDSLNSPSIKKYLESLKDKHQLVCLVFDQFEELYSKSDLFSVFEKAQKIFLSTSALQENFCLGFAWKTDSTTHTDHPAYYLWQKLSDHRITIKLSRFTESESNTVINGFQKEINEDLKNDLRHNLVSSSQGYPWLLKKLCIHLYNKMQSGEKQEHLIDNALDIAALFDDDLNTLTSAEKQCLDEIAKRAPVDSNEILEIFNAETLSSLIHKRLVIKSGNRLSIYWDIFREYILTKKTPLIPFSYVPSNDFSSIYKIAKNLSVDKILSISDLAGLCKLKENTIMNIGTDLIMFGIATREEGKFRLDKDLEIANYYSLLKRIRDKLKRHAFTITLSKQSSNSFISPDDAVNILKEILIGANYSDKTWKTYTERLCRWLVITGLLSKKENGWVCKDAGELNFQQLDVSGRHGKNYSEVFVPSVSPALAVEVLEWIKNNGQYKKGDKLKEGYRNALTLLSRFDLVLNEQDCYKANLEKIEKYNSAMEAIWKEAALENTLKECAIFLRANLDFR